MANQQGGMDLPNMRDDKSTDVLTHKSKEDLSYQPKEWNGKSSTDIAAAETGEGGKEKRETWGHKAEFILATVGFAVGLVNVWRFPYLCQKNGGGAFLIPYVIFMVIEGLPLFFLELSIGQRMRKSAIRCWQDVHPALFGIGVACLMVSLMLCLHYVVVIAWCCYYFFISFTKILPWEHDKLCPDYCKYMYTELGNAVAAYKSNSTCLAVNYTSLKNAYDNFPDCCVRDPPQYYFYHHAQQISTSIEESGMGMNGKLAGCLVFAWVITYLCVVKGIKSSGKDSTKDSKNLTTKKDSKLLSSLLNKYTTLQRICEVLDTPVPRGSNYKAVELVAQHYGFDHYQMGSILENQNRESPTRALIEFLAASCPDLTVEGFATVVEKKTIRNDVVKLLRAYDLAEENNVKK